MPQMNKGGKFIFGKSLIHNDGTIQFPAQAIEEYIPQLLNYTTESGEFIQYKRRKYCWTFISEKGEIILSHGMMKILNLKPEMKLLCFS